MRPSFLIQIRICVLCIKNFQLAQFLSSGVSYLIMAFIMIRIILFLGCVKGVAAIRVKFVSINRDYISVPMSIIHSITITSYHFVDPTKRQIFCDASAQIFSFMLRSCHITSLPIPIYEIGCVKYIHIFAY